MDRGKRPRSPTLADAHNSTHKDGTHRKEKEKKEKKEKKKKGGFESVDTEALIIEQKVVDTHRQAAELQEKEMSRQNNPGSMALVVAGTGSSAGGQLTVAGTRVATQLNNMTRETRRVHVSRLPRGVTEVSLRETIKVWIDKLRREMINDMLAARGSEKLKASDSVRIDEVLGVYLSDPTSSKAQFAFVELNTPDMTGKLVEASWEGKITMPGPMGEVCALNVKRPSNFRDLSTPEPNRMVLTSPPASVDEANWRAMCTKFGTVAEDQFFCIPGKYVYVEYVEDDAAEKGVSRLSGLVFQGTVLLAQLATAVQRAQVISSGCAVRSPEEDVLTGGTQNGEVRRDMVKELLDLETNAIKVLQLLAKEYPYLKSTNVVPVIPTRILVLYNLVDKAELEEDEDYYNLKQDISDEVERFGRVENLIVPRFRPEAPKPPQALELPPMPVFNPAVMITAGPNMGDGGSEDVPVPQEKSLEQMEYESLLEARAQMERTHQMTVEAWERDRAQWELDLDDPVKCGMGRVFVEYTSIDEALHAQQQLAGRLFNGRTVITSFLQEDILYPTAEEEQEADGDAKEEEEGEKNGQGSPKKAKQAEETDEARNARMAALVTETEDID